MEKPMMIRTMETATATATQIATTVGDTLDGLELGDGVGYSDGKGLKLTGIAEPDIICDNVIVWLEVVCEGTDDKLEARETETGGTPGGGFIGGVENEIEDELLVELERVGRVLGNVEVASVVGEAKAPILQSWVDC